MYKIMPTGMRDPEGHQVCINEDVRLPLDAREMKKARLALAILSGRRNLAQFGPDEFEALGYDTYKFSAYGVPDADDLMEKAETILFELLFRAGDA